MLTQKELRELFEYCDGKLIWKVSVHGYGGKKLGKEAGTLVKAGKNYVRRRIGIRGKMYMAHHLVFIYHHEHLPKQLDHIDRNPLNNRIENLRAADDSQQEANKSLRADNKSGFRGVFWNSQKKKWHSKIKHQHIGFYSNIIAAALAYNEKAKDIFGDFAYLNEV